MMMRWDASLNELLLWEGWYERPICSDATTVAADNDYEDHEDWIRFSFSSYFPFCEEMRILQRTDLSVCVEGPGYIVMGPLAVNQKKWTS